MTGDGSARAGKLLCTLGEAPLTDSAPARPSKRPAWRRREHAYCSPPYAVPCAPRTEGLGEAARGGLPTPTASPATLPGELDELLRLADPEGTGYCTLDHFRDLPCWQLPDVGDGRTSQR